MNFVSEDKELVQKYLPLTTTVSLLGYLMNEQVNKKVDRQTTHYSTRNKSVALDFHVIFEIMKKFISKVTFDNCDEKTPKTILHFIIDRLRSEVFTHTTMDITNYIRVATQIETKCWKCQDSPWSTTTSSSRNVSRNHRGEHDIFIDLHFPNIQDVNDLLKHLEHPDLVENEELIHFDDLFSLNSDLFIKHVAYSSRSGRKFCEKSECQCIYVKQRVKYIKAPQYLIFHTDRENMKKGKGKGKKLALVAFISAISLNLP